MVELNYAHLCDYATLTNKGKPLLVGIFSTLSDDKLPILVKNVFFVANLTVEDNQEHSVEFKIKDPNGEEVLDSYIDTVEKKEGKEKQGIILNISDVEFNEAGDYEIEVYSDGELLNSSKLTVVVDN